MPDAVCLSLKITFGQMEMQKLFTRKRKDPIEALQEQMRGIMEGHGAVTFGVQKLSPAFLVAPGQLTAVTTSTRALTGLDIGWSVQTVLNSDPESGWFIQVEATNQGIQQGGALNGGTRTPKSSKIRLF